MTAQIEHIREQLGYTQAQMAAEIGLSLRAYAEIAADPSKEKGRHVLAAQMVLLRSPNHRKVAVSLDALAEAFRRGQDKVDALPYTVTFEITGEPAVMLADGNAQNGMMSNNAVTGTKLADLLANPDAEIDRMLGFIAASMASHGIATEV